MQQSNQETTKEPLNHHSFGQYFWRNSIKLGPEMFLKLVAEPTIVAICNKIRESINGRGQSSFNLYVNFIIIKVLYDKKLLRSLPLYMEDVIVHFMNIRKENCTYYPEVYLDKTAVMKSLGRIKHVI